MSALVGVAQVDFPKIHEFGSTLGEALGETGNKEQSVEDKICNIIRLSKGGSLPSYKLFQEKIAKKTHYMLLMERLFGKKYDKVCVIHILLQ